MAANDKINVLLVNKIEDEGLKKIASISPRINILTTAHLWESSETAAGKDRDCDAGEFAELLAQAEVILGWRPPPHVVARAPRLKWFQTFLAGVDSILDKDLINSDVIITNTSGIHASQLTEITFNYMLMFMKSAPEYFQLKQERRWERHPLIKLQGKTLGIIGLGSIGRQMARVGKVFGMQVVATRRSAKKVTRARNVDVVYPVEQLDQLLRESDFVVMVLPSTPLTHKMIGAKELHQMKPTAYLINVGRGNTLVEEDLIRALEEKWIAGAGLDCFATEPLPRESRLWTLPNVIMTPHVAGLVDNYVSSVVDLFCENLKLYVQGKKLFNIVSKKHGY